MNMAEGTKVVLERFCKSPEFRKELVHAIGETGDLPINIDIQEPDKHLLIELGKNYLTYLDRVESKFRIPLHSSVKDFMTSLR